MTAFGAELPFDAPSQLTDPAVFVPLAIYCEGLEGRLAVNIRKAISYAIRSGYSCLNRQAFIEYLRTERRLADGLNPFLTNDDEGSYRAKTALAAQERMREAENRRSVGSNRKSRAAFGARGM